jgi:hypothetical protein
MMLRQRGPEEHGLQPHVHQVRDGILQAAADNHNGEDVCPMWEAFAAYGLAPTPSAGCQQHQPDERLQHPRELLEAATSRPANAGPIRT